MELSENERLMLVKKKEEILKLTTEILDIKNDPEQALEIKKKITNILSLLSTISSYAQSKYDSSNLWYLTTQIFMEMDLLGNEWTVISPLIEVFCNTVNFIEFKFTKKSISLKIPKIDLSLFKTTYG